MSKTSVVFRHHHRATPLTLSLVAGLILSGCTTTGGKQASLPDAPKNEKQTQNRIATAPVPARLPEERATDAQIAALGEPVMVEPQPAALDTPPTQIADASAPPQDSAPLDELVMAPTAASAGSNSIFASRQMAYAPADTSGTVQGSTSLVPSNLPVRSGINPSAGSLFSAPRPAASEQAYVEPAAVSQPDPAAEQLVTPEPAEVAYDPAEPVSEAAEPAEDGKKKSFSLMRLLGRKGS
ncbi:hypothetical protein [Rhizobium sp. RU36D]|uniref:hypothetical protein n=1 Tax=Rhizobium sp. RU36D TaxID=1907415 RepID=UPI0009D892C2|nr:hypothetical protein [Rhizobium sp. RU36D]SMC65934.1 hypothetical protein SAMN05880593_104107 [Rhizobium sp. RU36D]